MENIYQSAIRAVEEGAKFRVDFASRSLRIDGRYVIKNGKYEGTLGIGLCPEDDFLSSVEELYRLYKHSVPSERSEGKSKRYFKALPEKNLSHDAMMYGERRDKAQIELELYILCQILLGFRWNTESMGSWFWQSQSDGDLILLRQWFELANNKYTTKNH